MKPTLSPLFLVLLCLNIFKLSAQTINDESTGILHEYVPKINNAVNPCIWPEEYKLIEKRCNENAALYIHDVPAQRTSVPTLLDWPLRAAAGFTDCGYYDISAHVDQNTNDTTFKDYHCGSIAYDGHHGTDIATQPFAFYKMDNSQVEIIAAAAGTILDKHDGENDRNCVGPGTNLPANYVIIQHADGSRALYWHMKKTSVTSKAIGQPVMEGEYLGCVGSSGSSSGPHLHFEVWAGSMSATYVDPFYDTCNHLNAVSWWAAQKPYTEPAVIKASVHTTDYVPPSVCGTTEVSNESTSYTIPFQGPGLSPGYAKFYTFIRNQTSGDSIHLKILNPNSTVFNMWGYKFSATGNYGYVGFSRLLPTVQGTYIFQATYNSITCSQTFTILNPTGLTEAALMAANTRVYPNPFNASATVQLDREISNGEFIIYNVFGQNVKEIKNISGKEITLNRDYLTDGVYFIRLIADNKITCITKPIIIQSGF